MAIHEVQLKKGVLQKEIRTAIQEFQYSTGLWVDDIKIISPPPGNPDSWFTDSDNRRIRKLTVEVEVSIPDVNT